MLSLSALASSEVPASDVVLEALDPGQGRLEPMTVSQSAMVTHHAQWPESTAFQSAAGLLVAGRLNERLMRAAIDEVSADHALTRTRFLPATGGAFEAVVGGESCWRLVWSEDYTLGRSDLEGMARPFLRRPLHLEDGGLMTYAVVGREWTLITLVGHVAVVDAQSNALLICQLLQRYAVSAGLVADVDLAETRVKAWAGQAVSPSYAQIAREEADFLASPEAAGMIERQRAALAGGVVAELPLDRRRPKTPAMDGATLRRRMPAQEVAALRAAAASVSVTLYSVLLAAFELFLAERTGERDFVLGLMMTSRSSSRTRRIVGNFANIVPIRAVLDPESDVPTLAAQVHAAVPRALQTVSLPYWVLVQSGAHPTCQDGTPGCRVKFNALAAPVGEPVLESLLRGSGTGVDYYGLHVVGLDVPQSEGQLDLAAQVTHGRDFMNIDFRYDSSVLNEATVSADLDRYVEILRSAATALTESPIPAL